MNIVSFSLFGDNPLYITGAIENAILCQQVYPNWQVQFYVDSSIEPETIEKLKSYGATIVYVTEIYSEPAKQLVWGLFWRFFAVDSAGADYVIFRDCDSRVSDKERAAVSEWIESGVDFHFMYDHHLHTSAAMAGMWGMRARAVPNMRKAIENYFPRDTMTDRYMRYSDQRFLREVLWARYVDDDNYLAHGDYKVTPTLKALKIKVRPWPKHNGFCLTKEVYQTFVGQTIMTASARPKTPKI